MNQLKNNISKLCRCCMENGKQNLFTSMYETVPVVNILEICISEKVCSDDGLPVNVCQTCYDKIISSYMFILSFKKVQLQLLEILKQKIVVGDEKKIKSEAIDTCLESNEDFLLRRIDGLSKEINSNLSTTDELKLATKNLKHLASAEDLKNEHFKKQVLDDFNNENVFECVNNQESFSSDHFPEEYLRSPLDECSAITEKQTQSSTKISTSFQKYICSECDEGFAVMKQLDQHCRNTGHTNKRKFCCKICFKTFLSTTKLNNHMRTHNNDRPFECNECSMTFTSNSNLKRHKKRHTGEKSFFCEICGRGFIQKHTLTVHMRLHNGETPYVCELCGKGYRTKPLLHQHMYKHKDTETQIIRYRKYYLKYGKIKVECDICKKIITKSALHNHMKIKHGDGLKQFLCNLCGKTYATKMSLGVHMNIHTKQISYNCTLCPKSFTHQNYLKTHLMLHSGERPHCCGICSKTFVQRTHLDRHMRTHTGAKPFTCSYCDKSFALNENLKVHTRIHTGETPHLCLICGKGFFNSSSRKKHESSIHQMH